MKEHDYLLAVINDGYTGTYNKEFESMLASMYNVNYAIGVNSGTSALLVALAGIGIGAGDEVIVPALTFAAPAFAVEQIGAKPVFADCDPHTWNISTQTIEKLITRKTKAIIVVHLYGLPANMPEIMDLAHAYGLKVIEDCAEAFLAGIRRDLVGTFGDMGVFSFQKNKHLTAGSGGAVVTNNEEHARRARKYSILGYSTLTASGSCGTKESIQYPDFNRHYTMGYNFVLPELCAAVLVAQLEKAEGLVSSRIAIANIFDKVVNEFPQCERQKIPKEYRHTYWAYVFALPVGASYYEFRNKFLRLGGHPFYAAWKPVPCEPWFNIANYSVFSIDEILRLQPRLICLNTGFNLKEGKEQAEILREALQLTI